MMKTRLITGLASVAFALLHTAPVAAADYFVTITTDRRDFAGTNANVWITLGEGQPPSLDQCESLPRLDREHVDHHNKLTDHSDLFAKGQTDIFSVAQPDLSEVSWICLRHDDTSDHPGWFVNTVVVQKKGSPAQSRFFVFQWLATDARPSFKTAVVSLQGQPLPFLNGGAHTCDNFFYSINVLGFGFELDTPDLGWVRVQESNAERLLGRPGASLPKFRSATGSVTRSVVNFQDFPDAHDSHDFNLDVLLDPVLADFTDLPILSDVGIDANRDHIPDTLHLEWETGILTNQTRGVGRFFPQWAWPIEDDRVWANGYWIFDCGHPEDGSLQSEIHPIRAIASMRQQVVPNPDGGAAIPVTTTRLYIHGRAGVATDVLECGQTVIIHESDANQPGACEERNTQFTGWQTDSLNTPIGCHASSDGPNCAGFRLGDRPYPNHDIARDHLGIPIADLFEFDICTPPKPGGPNGAADLITWLADGFGNTIRDSRFNPKLRELEVGAPNEDPCASPDFGPVKVHVSIDLRGSGVAPDDVYARTIYAGWVASPPVIRHFFVRLENMRVLDTHEGITEDCECTFFWMNVDRAPNEWIRLSDFTDDDMDDVSAGETINFTGALFDFFVEDGQDFTIRADGFDGGVSEGFDAKMEGQDCFDDHFGHHDFSLHTEVHLFPAVLVDPCYFAAAADKSQPNDDPFSSLVALFGPFNGYGLGEHPLQSTGGDFELTVTVFERVVDLQIAQTVSNQNAAAGEDVTITITVTNAADDRATGIQVLERLPLEGLIVSAVGGGGGDCRTTPSMATERGYVCELGDLEKGETATVRFIIRPTQAGSITSTASVSGNERDFENSNDRFATTVNVSLVADVVVEPILAPDTVLLGDNVTFVITITNHGPSDVKRLSFSYSFVGTFVSVTLDGLPGECSPDAAVGFRVNCDVHGLESHQSHVFRMTFKADRLGAHGSVAVVGVLDAVDPRPDNNENRAGTTVVLPGCAQEISNKVTVSLGGFRRDRVTGTFVQTVTLRTFEVGLSNVVVMLEGLSANATLKNAAGSTSCVLPKGSPFVVVPDLPYGVPTTITLQFANPTLGRVVYEPRVLAGPGTP
jgi:uncharacterized repeat protein (TIGR01451 family)